MKTTLICVPYDNANVTVWMYSTVNFSSCCIYTINSSTLQHKANATTHRQMIYAHYGNTYISTHLQKIASQLSFILNGFNVTYCQTHLRTKYFQLITYLTSICIWHWPKLGQWNIYRHCIVFYLIVFGWCTLNSSYMQLYTPAVTIIIITWITLAVMLIPYQ